MTQAQTTRVWKFSALSAFACVMTVLGTSVMVYPSTAAWFSQKAQSQLIDNYKQHIADANPPAATQIDAAHTYNEALESGAIVGAFTNVPSGTGTGGGVAPYRQQLHIDGIDVMARLRIPSIDVDLPIYHGTDDDTLLRGAGHLEGTSCPWADQVPTA